MSDFYCPTNSCPIKAKFHIFSHTTYCLNKIKKRMKIFALLSIISIVSAERDLPKKIKNKKSRLLRKLKKQAPANVAADGTIGFV